MKEVFEWVGYIAVVAVLGVFNYNEGVLNNEMKSRLPLSAKELYKQLGSSQIKLQILDVRADSSEYEDTHIPGAIPFPNCDFEATPESAKSQIFSYSPTVIISKDGDNAVYEKCLQKFKVARNLAGGIDAWVEASYPEDSGEYTPPKAGGGGGCL